MGIVEATGIVTREIKYGDSSRILTVITKELGKISVLAGGVRSNKSGLLAATQLFSYVQFTLFQGRGKGLYKINAGEMVNSFAGLRESLDKTAYASYFCEIANDVVQENNPDPQQLGLLLNSLYMLTEGRCPMEQVKAVYEFRTLSVQGVLPELDRCGICGSEKPSVLDLQNGCAYCGGCAAKAKGGTAIGSGLMQAITYIAVSDSKKIFSFRLPEKSLQYLSELGEYCIQLHLEKRFKTLDYLKSVRALEAK